MAEIFSFEPKSRGAHGGGMKRHPGSPMAERCIRLRKALGYDYHGGQKDFALRLGVNPDRWNNVERGVPLGKELAFIVAQKIPGVDPLWLWFGTTGGLSVQMAQLLGELPMTNRTGASSSKQD